MPSSNIKYIAISALLLAVPCAALAVNQINWGTTWNYDIWDEGGIGTGTRLSDGGPYGDGMSSLVQLVYAGADGRNDVIFGDVGSGEALTTTSGDDAVLAYSWIGAGVGAAAQPGSFYNLMDNNTYPNGSEFFIRAWTLAADVALTGERIVAVDDYYGDSPSFFVTQNGSPPAGNEEFYLSADFYNSHQVLPEPGTFALFGIGIAVVSLRRRFAKKS